MTSIISCELGSMGLKVCFLRKRLYKNAPRLNFKLILSNLTFQSLLLLLSLKFEGSKDFNLETLNVTIQKDFKF